VKGVDVICPAFSADCLETLEEMAIANRELFVESGGSEYRYIPCLNDRPDHVVMLAALARNSLGLA
jgi:ferrochelatase